MSHVTAHVRQTKTGKTVFVREHLKKDSIPRHDAVPEGYEGPFHGEKGEVKYRYSTTNHANPAKRMSWSSEEHPEDRYKAEIAEYEKMKNDLAMGLITPRRIIGRGYSPGKSRKIAEQYIEERIQFGKKDLEEVLAKKIPRHDPNDRLPLPEKPKKDVQHRLNKEAADHLFGKDIKKSLVSGYMRRTKNGKIVAVREHNDKRAKVELGEKGKEASRYHVMSEGRHHGVYKDNKLVSVHFSREDAERKRDELAGHHQSNK